MDFNSIFGRSHAPLEGPPRGEDFVFELWATYLDEIFPYGLTNIAFEKLQNMHRVLRERVIQDDFLIERERGTIFHQSNMLDKRQTLALLAEIDRFVRTKEVVEPISSRAATALADFLDTDVDTTYKIVLHSLFQPVYDAVEGLTPALRNNAFAKERRLKSVGEAYDTFNADMPRLRQRYEFLKKRVKGVLPPRFHSLIDQVVELFVYEPYETGLLYIRRHLPGAVGAFHGLEEEG